MLQFWLLTVFPIENAESRWVDFELSDHLTFLKKMLMDVKSNKSVPSISVQKTWWQLQCCNAPSVLKKGVVCSFHCSTIYYSGFSLSFSVIFSWFTCLVTVDKAWNSYSFVEILNYIVVGFGDSTVRYLVQLCSCCTFYISWCIFIFLYCIPKFFRARQLNKLIQQLL